MSQRSRSKVVDYGLEEEVVSLLMDGKGVNSIARYLNDKHDLPTPLNHVNIINFKKSLGSDYLNAIKEQHVKEYLIDPVKKARDEVREIKEGIMPKLRLAIEDGDMAKVRTLSDAFVKFFDRWAKIEHIIEPRQEYRARYIKVQQQFNLVSETLERMFTKLCPNCQGLVMDYLKPTSQVIETDVGEIDET